MTDGRIPGKWINEPRFAEMDVDTWCVFTKAIAFSNEAGTDGHVKHRYLPNLHPSGERQPKTYERLTDLGLWKPVADGYQFIGWSVKAHHGGLGQATAESVKRNRQNARDRQRKHREGVTRDITRSEGRDVGQDTTGQDRTGLLRKRLNRTRRTSQRGKSRRSLPICLTNRSSASRARRGAREGRLILRRPSRRR